MTIELPVIVDHELTRDYARKVFEDSSLTYDDVNKESLKILRAAINKQMIRSGLMRGTLRMNPTRTNRFLTCKSHYFDNREAVSFNDEGFIGFAGWADNRNIEPILQGFIDWVYEVERVK